MQVLRGFPYNKEKFRGFMLYTNLSKFNTSNLSKLHIISTYAASCVKHYELLLSCESLF